jgi:hypothetical protein
MLFPFTFSISVPGIMNPFSKSLDLRNDTGHSPAPAAAVMIQDKRWLAVRRPHPSALPPPVPLARKRGWQPSTPEPSPATTVTTSTRGQVNIPPKYRDFTVTPEAREEEQGMEDVAAAGESHVRLTDPAYILSRPIVVSQRVPAAVRHVIFTQHRGLPSLYTRATFFQCSLLMAPMCTRCMIFTLLYSSVLLWAFFGLMVISFHVCIELPPAKRRRTLAGSIVSGAVNAALIGTAVGLTVYRLYVFFMRIVLDQRSDTIFRWRDRGRAPELEPPPYEQGDWVPSEVSNCYLSIRFPTV